MWRTWRCHDDDVITYRDKSAEREVESAGRITLYVYTQATTTNKRAAQGRVVKMMVPNLDETKGAVHPQNAQ